MVKIFRTAAAIAVAAALVSPAAAQGWSFSYGVGDPYADPYYRPAYPPPPVYHGPPVLIVPAPAPGRRAVVLVSPREIENDLRANGFTRIRPGAVQGEFYMLTAIDPRGNLVDLTISMRNGQFVRTKVIAVGVQPDIAPAPRPAKRAAPAKPAPKVATAPKPKRQPQEKPAPAAREPAPKPKPVPAAPAPAAGEPDPLVVY